MHSYCTCTHHIHTLNRTRFANTPPSALPLPSAVWQFIQQPTTILPVANSFCFTPAHYSPSLTSGVKPPGLSWIQNITSFTPYYLLPQSSYNINSLSCTLVLSCLVTGNSAGQAKTDAVSRLPSWYLGIPAGLAIHDVVIAMRSFLRGCCLWNRCPKNTIHEALLYGDTWDLATSSSLNGAINDENLHSNS